MKLVTTTGDFRRFAPTYEERIDHVIDAGFKYVDLSLYVIDKDDELLISNNWHDNAKRILEHTNKKGCNICSGA